jgi:hypothetical protein
METIKRYSWSLFEAYQKCSKIVFFEKICQIEKEPRDYFEHGSKVHEEVDKYHKGQKFDEELIKRYTEVIPKDYYTHTEDWINAFIHNPSNKAEKIETEFCGKLDGRGKDFIADLKTMGGSISQKTADEMGQITLYLYMDWINTGEIKKFRILNHRKDRNSKGELFPLQIIDTTRTIEDFQKLWKELKVMDNSIKKNIFYKEPSYECAYCQYKRLCKAEK